MIYSILEAHVRENVDNDNFILEDGGRDWNAIELACYSECGTFFKDDAEFDQAFSEIVFQVGRELRG
ncbi:MAG: hypothetical protein N0C84_00675 [Candidatus Thiodiazotropha taylori]|uniref:Uncharacterized protein n=1 Tax=Candidatus Thiodiazotropha taylori TaxID=2792791 RepID=A0A9E4KA10_9GAMM|nr:hypothetical protein [Candidatus Thiodiazotropha taylori]MCW4254959.1 hypothetical protein [Candidatus Thiodiazotropha taylori]